MVTLSPGEVLERVEFGSESLYTTLGIVAAVDEAFPVKVKHKCNAILGRHSGNYDIIFQVLRDTESSSILRPFFAVLDFLSL